MREQDDRGRIAMAVLKAEQKALQKGKEDAVIGFYENDVPIPIIAKSLRISIESVEEVIKIYKKTERNS
jgi:hypothetical protein